MTKHCDKKLSRNNNINTNTSGQKKWLTLSLIGAALLLIPRRSSRQDSALIDKEANQEDKELH